MRTLLVALLFSASVWAGTPYVWIDSPIAGPASGTISVAGWAIDNTTSVGELVTSVIVQVDGHAASANVYGLLRVDVCNVFPGRAGCPNVGYSFSLDSSTLSSGLHTITVVATDAANETGSASVTISTGGGCGTTACVSGDWSNPTTWGGSLVPSGVPVKIGDGISVTVSSKQIAGSSGPAGSIAIDFGNSGSVRVVNGGDLQMRGDCQYAAGAGANTSTYLQVDAGGILEFDSSQNPSVAYSCHPDGNKGYRQFLTTGTAAGHAIVRSNPVGAHGYFSNPLIGGNYVTTYTDFIGIGDANNPAFGQWSDGGGPTAWDATHDTFTGCGLAPSAPNSSLGAADIFRHDHNVHTGSQGNCGGQACVFLRPDGYSNLPVMTNGGVREVVGNVFDAAPSFAARDFTIHSNYFGAQANFTSPDSYVWARFENNFYRQTLPSPIEMMAASGDVLNSIFLVDVHSAANIHGIDLRAGSVETLQGDIVEHAGNLTSSPSAAVITNATNLKAGTYTVRNTIIPPNAAGHASFWLTTPIQNIPANNVLFSYEHNTIMADSVSGTAVYTDHGPGMSFAGQIASYRSNILWNPIRANPAYKLQSGLGLTTDVCAPAMCDYNDGFNTLGYSATFSAAPGAHDITANPMFVDPTRNTATFDSAYLGNHYASWSAAAQYSVGALVSLADPSLYAGAAINYRYTNGSYNGIACASANPQPSAYSDQARACWEWASLYRIRQGVASQTLYDDQIVGAHGVDIITTLMQWIRAGFSPSNPALALAGHDGQDIGAVPYSAAPIVPPSSPLGPTTLAPTTVRGGTVRGGQLQ